MIYRWELGNTSVLLVFASVRAVFAQCFRIDKNFRVQDLAESSFLSNEARSSKSSKRRSKLMDFLKRQDGKDEDLILSFPPASPFSFPDLLCVGRRHPKKTKDRRHKTHSFTMKYY